MVRLDTSHRDGTSGHFTQRRYVKAPHTEVVAVNAVSVMVPWLLTDTTLRDAHSTRYGVSRLMTMCTMFSGVVTL